MFVSTTTVGIVILNEVKNQSPSTVLGIVILRYAQNDMA